MADEDGARSPSVPAEQEAETQAEGSDRALQLPLARIRKIIKLDKDIGTCGNESSLAIARATVRNRWCCACRAG